jgi:hypothetical protein
VAQRANPVGLLRRASLLWPGGWYAVGLAEASPGAAGEAAGCWCPELGPSGARRREPACRRTAEVGPKPADRGGPGAKRHLAADVQRTPFDLTLSVANRHDSREFVPNPDAVPGLRARHQSRLTGDLPSSTPATVDDRRRCHRECRTCGNVPRIARSIESGNQAMVPPPSVLERHGSALLRLLYPRCPVSRTASPTRLCGRLPQNAEPSAPQHNLESSIKLARSHNPHGSRNNPGPASLNIRNPVA